VLPNKPLNAVRPNAPPLHVWNITATTQETEGKVYKLHGKAEIEGATMVFRADEMEFNEDTGDLKAAGNVFYQNFTKNEKVWADHLDYNTEQETGKFYKVHGETSPRIDARPGILTTNNPFYFEGDWAERVEDKYILHDGFVTNCKVPSPWWTLRGPKFDIIPGERAIARNSIFRVRGVPLFYTPFFYKSLEKEPRKSGFLIPNLGNDSQRGIMLGLGYFWAINRSYDLTYRLQEYPTRGQAHHLDFRGKPRAGTDYDAIFYGVQDRGIPQPSGPPITFSGASLYALGKSDLGGGWYVRGQINYISSFRFRQNWTESFNEAIGSEIQSVGVVTKNWSNYTFSAVAERLQNYQSSEIPVVNPVTLATTYQSNAVTIHKLPEAELEGRERQIWKDVPLWFSFDSAVGLLFRSEPLFSPANVLIDRFQTSQFMNRMNLAPTLMSSLHFGGFHLVPRFGLQETYYSQSQTFNPAASQTLNTPAYQVIGTDLLRSSREVSVDLIFPTLARVFSKKTIFGDKLKHVIEPRITYHYVTGVENDFSRFIRFDETDLLSNTNEVEFSLTNRLYAKRGNNVDEVFSWQLRQARYLDPTFGGAFVPGQANLFLSTVEMTPFTFLVAPRSSSPVASALRMSPLPNLGVEWRADYDHAVGSIIDNTVSVDYRYRKYFLSVGDTLMNFKPILQKYFPLGVPATPNPILVTAANQFRWRIGFGDPNHRGWNAGVDAVYDYDQGHLAYATAQVTYNTNCCGLSVQLRRFSFGTRNENQYRVAFSVSNIGTFGTLRRQDRLF